MILNPFQTPYLIPIKLQTTYFHGNHWSSRICYWLHPSFHRSNVMLTKWPKIWATPDYYFCHFFDAGKNKNIPYYPIYHPLTKPKSTYFVTITIPNIQSVSIALPGLYLIRSACLWPKMWSAIFDNTALAKEVLTHNVHLNANTCSCFHFATVRSKDLYCFRRNRGPVRRQSTILEQT